MAGRKEAKRTTRHMTRNNAADIKAERSGKLVTRPLEWMSLYL